MRRQGPCRFPHQMPEIGVARQEILGFVVGFWRPMREVLPVDQP
jgi:hypothetical protein